MMKDAGHTARLIPKHLSQYFPECARAYESFRIDLIALGSAYAGGYDGRKANGIIAMWAWTLAAFEDEAYYNEIGKEPLSTATYNYREIQMTAFFESLPPLKRYLYRKLMGLMDSYLEINYYKQPQRLFLLFGCWFRNKHKGFIDDILPEMLFLVLLVAIAVVLCLILK